MMVLYPSLPLLIAKLLNDVMTDSFAKNHFTLADLFITVLFYIFTPDLPMYDPNKGKADDSSENQQNHTGSK